VIGCIGARRPRRRRALMLRTEPLRVLAIFDRMAHNAAAQGAAVVDVPIYASFGVLMLACPWFIDHIQWYIDVSRRRSALPEAQIQATAAKL